MDHTDRTMDNNNQDPDKFLREQECSVPHSRSSSCSRMSPRDVHGFQWCLVVVSLMSVTFLWGLDGTITAAMQATFVQDFGSIRELAYNSVAFFLGAAATVLSWGQVYGTFNAKWTLITCICIFEIGSTICGAAPDINALIAGRAVAGIGGSGMYVGVMTLLSLTTTVEERALYMGLPGITWGIGTVLGPIIGGGFAQSSATWRWGFYINLCVGALFAPVYVFLVPSKDVQAGFSWRSRLAGIDFAGLSLLAGSTTALLLAVNSGGLTYGWQSDQMIVLWTIGAVLTVCFAVQQVWSIATRNALFPLTMMRNLSVAIIFVNETCSATLCFLPCYFIPLYFQYVRGEQPLKAGVHLLPFIISMVTTVMICGFIVGKIGRWIPWFLYGGISAVIGGSLMLAIDEPTAAQAYGFSVLIGTGAGAYIQMPFNAVQECVSPTGIPAAVGLITWGQLAAPAFTLSIANTVFLNVAQGIGAQYMTTLGADAKSRVVDALASSMSLVYALVVCSAALTLVLSPALFWSTRPRPVTVVGQETESVRSASDVEGEKRQEDLS